jgi:hypothetical protein
MHAVQISNTGALQSRSNTSDSASTDPSQTCCTTTLGNQDLLDCLAERLVQGAPDELAISKNCNVYRACAKCAPSAINIRDKTVELCKGTHRSLEAAGYISSYRRRRGTNLGHKEANAEHHEEQALPPIPPFEYERGEGIAPSELRSLFLQTHQSDIQQKSATRTEEEFSMRQNASISRGSNWCVHPGLDPASTWGCGSPNCLLWAIEDCNGTSAYCLKTKACGSQKVDCRWKKEHCDGWSTNCCEGQYHYDGPKGDVKNGVDRPWLAASDLQMRSTRTGQDARKLDDSVSNKCLHK